MPRHHLLMYGKAHCPLCDKARQTVRRAQRRYVLSLEETDITEDPELFARYQYEIPVIVIDDTLILKAPIEEESLLQALATLEAGRSW